MLDAALARTQLILGRTRTSGKTASALAEGSQFLAGAWDSATGHRPYRLYVPAATIKSPPLVVMLHGCGQSPEDFAAGTCMNNAAEAHGCLVLYPGQTREANAMRCWNWFEAAEQLRPGHGEADLLVGMTRSIVAAHDADPDRVYVAGLSAGGAEAALLASLYPDVFAALGVHSGLAAGAAHDAGSAMAAMRGPALPVPSQASRPPTIVFHGDHDTTVHIGNADLLVGQLVAGSGFLPRRAEGRTPSGRTFTRVVYADRSGRDMLEQWTVHGGGHAWSGGNPGGSFTDPSGPDATREMLRFFLQHRRGG